MWRTQTKASWATESYGEKRVCESVKCICPINGEHKTSKTCSSSLSDSLLKFACFLRISARSSSGATLLPYIDVSRLHVPIVNLHSGRSLSLFRSLSAWREKKKRQIWGASNRVWASSRRYRSNHSAGFRPAPRIYATFRRSDLRVSHSHLSHWKVPFHRQPLY